MNHARIRTRALAVALAGALSLISAGRAAAQGDDDVEDGPSRVARLALVSGDVSILEPQGYDWQNADQNEALFEGTEIYAGDRGRAEIALGSRSYLRIANGADVTLSGLDRGWVQLTVASGTAVLSIETTDRGEQYSMSAPAAAVTPNGPGVYRVDIADNGDTWVTLQSGNAELSTPAGSFQGLAGDVATFGYDDPNDVDLVGDAARDYQDDLDDWVADRTNYYDDLDRRNQPAPVLALGDRDDIYGLSELVRYGSWLSLGDGQYGWQPQYARDPDWSPYQDGYWDYSTVTGYTWVSNEPWGWAPYHYGRWNYDDRAGWVWFPTHGSRTSFGSRDTARYQWKPALVYLWQSPDTSSYAWVPLAPGERYVPFSEPTIAMTRRTQRAPAAESFRPRYLQERRGVVSLSPTALASRQKPAKAAPAAQATASVPTAQMVAPKVVEIPKPTRAAVVAPARVKPTVAVRQRAVVVDAAAAASAPKPTSATTQALRAQAKPARAERKAAKQALRAERKSDSGQGATTAAQPAQTTTPGASPAVLRPGKRGGRKQATADSGTGVRTPAGDATVTPAPRGNRGNGRNRDVAPDQQTTPTPPSQRPPVRTTAPADAGTTTDAPATTDANAPGKGKGRGQGKNKNRPKPGDPTTPATPPPPPTTERPAPQ